MPPVPFRTRAALALACGLIAIFTANAFARPAPTTPSVHAAPTVAAAAKAPARATPSRPRAIPRRAHVHRSPLARLRVSARGHARIPHGTPRAVRRLIRSANRIARTPYVWGGGHGSWRAAGYDCSGSVSYALHGARLLSRPATSSTLAGYGRPGKGRWVTIYANGGHAYMVVAGVRFDTSARGVNGSRWTRAARGNGGFVARHPAGL